MHTDREPMDQLEFDSCYGAKRVDRSVIGKIADSLPYPKDIQCVNVGRWVLSWFPLFAALKEYNFPADLLSDALAGFTVGIMNIPQGMAYGLLAGLEPVNGLYVSLVLPFVYAFLTKSHHIAMGTFAVISLMVNGVINNLHENLSNNGTNASGGFWCGYAQMDASEADIKELTQIAMALSLLVGLIQIVLGMLHFGFMASYLSDSLVQGLTTGAALHVFTSQVSHMTGIKGLPNTSTPLGLLRVVISTLVSWGFSLKPKFEISIVGVIPKRLPAPMVPDTKWFSSMIPDAIAIAVVSYALNVSLGKILSKRLGYPMDINQEWFSTGISHVIASFFQCHPGGASLSRSLVQSTAGGKTQLVSIFSSLMILIVLAAIADMFQDLPKCALAAIIVVALRGMFLQLKVLPELRKKSSVDFVLWIVSFSSVVLLNVSYGLMISVVFALFTLIFRMQWPSYSRLGKIRGTEVYKNIDAYVQSHELANIRIFRFDAPLTFVNADAFMNSLIQCTDIDPVEEKRKIMKKSRRLKVTEPPTTVVEVESNKDRIEHLVIDCSSIAYVDMMGMQIMLDAYVLYQDIHIQVLFASCKIEVRETLQRCRFFDKVAKSHLFPTLEDAVRVATGHIPLSRSSSLESTASESCDWRF